MRVDVGAGAGMAVMRRGRVAGVTAAVVAMVTAQALAPGAARAATGSGPKVETTVAATGLESLTPATPVTPVTRKPEVNRFLTMVNKARADVGVPPLVWDDAVAAHARSWARVRVADCRIVHSNSRYGENLAKGSDPDYSMSDAARLWIDEKPDYDRPSNSCENDRECLHYTQVVWRGSTRVGAAKARCANGWTYVAANFDPPGNWVGRRPY
ncbi:pathogenesis-related family 1 protein [Streptomyces adelaidensis]|uniref:pathogenesis-related family 1 protein n=1 Tax=Streptomyces adelaidensis TaxID=2796465 RepID=UPI001F1D0ABD|nr:pathogenesis-related family 1 protein [Streptomyces adelaidensis]